MPLLVSYCHCHNSFVGLEPIFLSGVPTASCSAGNLHKQFSSTVLTDKTFTFLLHFQPCSSYSTIQCDVHSSWTNLTDETITFVVHSQFLLTKGFCRFPNSEAKSLEYEKCLETYGMESVMRNNKIPWIWRQVIFSIRGHLGPPNMESV